MSYEYGPELPSLPRKVGDTWTCFRCNTVNSGVRCEKCGYWMLDCVHNSAPANPVPVSVQNAPQSAGSDKVWTCPKAGCGYEYNMSETCLKCRTAKPAVNLSQSLPSSAYHQAQVESAGGMQTVNTWLTQTQPQYPSLPPLTSVDAVLSVRVKLTKEGWICEACQAKNHIYYTFCATCNQPNSIGRVLLETYQGAFGEANRS